MEGNDQGSCKNMRMQPNVHQVRQQLNVVVVVNQCLAYHLVEMLATNKRQKTEDTVTEPQAMDTDQETGAWQL